MREPQTQPQPANTQALASFAKFDITGDDSTRRQCVQMLEAFGRFVGAIRRHQAPRWLSFVGKSGNGKTHLAKAIFGWAQRTDHLKVSLTSDNREIVYPTEWCWWPGLAETLKGNGGYGRLADVRSAKLTVIDELNHDRSPHVVECLANALCARVGKWTVITSNLSLEEIRTRIDTRVASRMLRDGSEVIDVAMVDYNVRKR